MSKNITLLGIALALVVGAAVGYFVAGSRYSAQLERAKKALPTTPFVNVISGKVKSVSGNVVTVTVSPSPNPFDEWPTTRQVVVTKSAKIVKQEQKDPKVFQTEFAQYQQEAQKGIKPGTAPPTLPLPYVEKEISISDLKAGDTISVDAGKDVKTAASFDAVKITVTGIAAPTPTAVAGPAVSIPTAPAPVPTTLPAAPR